LAEGVRDGAAALAAHDYLFNYRQGKVSATLDIADNLVRATGGEVNTRRYRGLDKSDLTQSAQNRHDHLCKC
jgi:hypothetical protein